MFYTTQIRIHNGSPWTFILDQAGSKGIQGGNWPLELPKKGEKDASICDIQHHWAWQVRFEARYLRLASGEHMGFCLKFYGDGVEVFECALEKKGFETGMTGKIECPHSRVLRVIIQ